jgi:hypothetical protein
MKHTIVQCIYCLDKSLRTRARCAAKHNYILTLLSTCYIKNYRQPNPGATYFRIEDST